MVFLTVENDCGGSPLFFLTVGEAFSGCHITDKALLPVMFSGPRSFGAGRQDLEGCRKACRLD